MFPGTLPGSSRLMTNLQIGGRVPFTTVDMPGRNAAVLFCQGCSWRCRYCHNAHLQHLRPDSPIAWDAILSWLEPRRGFLDAVVFSGGEPLLQLGLCEAMSDVKALGFDIGLHTGGCSSRALKNVLPWLDWIGIDIKAPRHAYDRITGVPGSGKAAWESLEVTLQSDVSIEVRTTYHPDLLTESELSILAIELASSGATNWIIQNFRAQGCADKTLTENSYSYLTGAFVNRLETIFLGNATRKGIFHSHPGGSQHWPEPKAEMHH